MGITDIHLLTLLTLIATFKLLEKISKEQKSLSYIEDFNVKLLNYNKHNQTNEFLDYIASNSSIPLILQPTTITSHSNTVIDNIFSSIFDPDKK